MLWNKCCAPVAIGSTKTNNEPMNSFLHDAARSLRDNYGDRISDLTVVFTSRRAERFFLIELSKLGCSAKPNFTTIDGVMGGFSGLAHAEDLVVLSELYNIYTKYHVGETFDKFYSFGKLLLADFDSVDKYMVDARELYSVVSDTRDVEHRFADELHERAIEFWGTFQRGKAQMHSEQLFLQIWQSLYAIYEELNGVLVERGEGYSGMIYRRAAQNVAHIDPTTLPHYVFVGLNALSRSEEVVLGALRDCARADFIWDFDPEWARDEMNEAFHFIRTNIVKFPQSDYFKASQRTENPLLEVIASPTEVMQTKITGQVLQEIASSEPSAVIDHRTAVILPDENLIEPLLHSIPPCAAQINVSIGYPLGSTQAYILLGRLIALQTSASTEKGFYHTAVVQLLQHPLIDLRAVADEVIATEDIFIAAERIPAEALDTGLFCETGGGAFDLHKYLCQSLEYLLEKELVDDLQRFALCKILSVASTLIATISKCRLSISRNIYISLLDNALRAERITYEGVSGRGLQILGILETRTLDFDNVVILSMNDDNFPNAKMPSSYIPQNLRTAYGLPSVAEHSAIWSYYFFRLLTRARRVTMVYCSSTDEKSSGEPSRYIYQLKYSARVALNERGVEFLSAQTARAAPIVVEKSEQMALALGSRHFSPSAINRYVRCPLAFYMNDVAAIRREERSVEQISALDVGNTLHLTMQELYTPIIGHPDARAMIGKITRDSIANTVRRVIERTCSSKADTLAPAMTLARVAIERMVGNIVAYDARQGEPFTVAALEVEMSYGALKGTIDRVDRLANGSVRVVDYKSGGDELRIKSVEEIIDGSLRGTRGAVLQVLIYSLLAAKKYSAPVTAALYVARKMGTPGYAGAEIVLDGSKLSPIPPAVIDELEVRMSDVVGQIIDPEIAFSQSDNRPQCCQYCLYRPVCLT